MMGQTSMAVAIPETQLARKENGDLLLNGFFAVDHPKGLRAIFDGRPANPGETRLKWTRLPAGPCWPASGFGETKPSEVRVTISKTSSIN